MSYFGTPLYPASLPDQTAVVSIVGNTTLAAGAATYGKVYTITGAGGYTITLPVLDGTNWPSKTFTIHNNSSALCTVNTAGSDTAYFFGSTYSSMSILPGERLLVQNIVTNWVISVDSSSRTTTAPQFDNTIRTASTAFVRQMGMQASSFIQPNAATYTLDSTSFGATLNNNYLGGAATWTMPPANTAVAGTRIEVINYTLNNLVVNAAAGNNFIRGQGTVFNSMTLGAGDSAVYEYNGGTVWLIVGGSAALPGSGAFGSSIVSPGYQKLPSGLIIQWGLATGSASADTAVTFPLSFPSNVLNILTSPATAGTGGFTGFNSQTKNGCNVNSWSATSTRSALSVYWVAIGY